MRLTAYVDGVRVGWFEQNSGGAVALEYDRAWQQRRSRVELSVSLPKSRRRHDGGGPVNYLWNLLPDNVDVLERWGRHFGVSPRNPVALLAHVGLDAAGAVQLVDTDVEDSPILIGGGGFEVIGDGGVATHLRRLRLDPAAWAPGDLDGGYFSLAGAQSKFTLARTPDGWAVPLGRSASTHIVKPGVRGLALSDLSEHLTMRAASLLGLNVAESALERFEDQAAIVVTRFDRRFEGDEVTRVHQEDLAQATGLHPSQKYQNDGGPGIAAIGALLGTELQSGAAAAVSQFFDATLFNWAALGTDAHAKNYALISADRRPSLAPLYDLGSGLAYPEINNRKAKLAMSYGGHYRAVEIEPRHIVAEAAGVGIAEAQVMERARVLTANLPDAFDQAVREADLTGDERVFAATLVDRARERADVLSRQLR